MSVTGAAVVFIIVWFLAMFILLPIEMRSQGDEGEVVPGTHAGAPADFRLRRTLLRVTLWTLPIWAVICGIIISGVISVDDLDFFQIMEPRIPN